MKTIYWIIALVLTVLVWVTLFGLISGMFILPYFEQLVADQAASGLDGALGKLDQIQLKVREQRVLRDFGTIGGVVFGFFAGACAILFIKDAKITRKA